MEASSGKEWLYKKVRANRGPVCAIKSVLLNWKERTDEYISLLKLALMSRDKLYDYLATHDGDTINMDTMAPLIQDYDPAKVQKSKHNTKIKRTIHLLEMTRSQIKTRTTSHSHNPKKNRYPKRKPTCPLHMTLRSSNKLTNNNPSSSANSQPDSSTYFQHMDPPHVARSSSPNAEDKAALEDTIYISEFKNQNEWTMEVIDFNKRLKYVQAHAASGRGNFTTIADITRAFNNASVGSVITVKDPEFAVYQQWEAVLVKGICTVLDDKVVCQSGYLLHDLVTFNTFRMIKRVDCHISVFTSP
eukprot:933086_1